MDDIILFYLLERPRSVSDMIDELTDKELSPEAEERSEEIPRIAGNWFREGSGYLWRLQERGLVNDRGRQYAIDREAFVEELLAALQVHRCFPEQEVRGDDATLTDAYARMMPGLTRGGLKQQLRSAVFSGSPMKQLFAFDRWKEPLLAADTNNSRVASYRLPLDFWPSVHFILLSTVLSSRERHITERLDEESEQYFHWRRRRQALVDSRTALRDAVVRACVPAADIQDGEVTGPERARQLAEGFEQDVDVLDPDAAELLATLYLLSFNDGVELFRQYSRYDHDINLFFNLLERGWLVDRETVERDERTGNLVIPLADVRSYLHDLTSLFRRPPS